MVPSRHPAMSAQPAPTPAIPDAETLRLHLGELTPGEVRVAQAAYRLALAQHLPPGHPTEAQIASVPSAETLARFYEAEYLAEWERRVAQQGIRPGFNRGEAERRSIIAGVAEVARRVTQSITQGAHNVR